MAKAIEVFRFDTGEVVDTIKVKYDSPRNVERTMAGMLINMSPEYGVREVDVDEGSNDRTAST